jgi:hypothetical protein
MKHAILTKRQILIRLSQMGENLVEWWNDSALLFDCQKISRERPPACPMVWCGHERGIKSRTAMIYMKKEKK